MRFTADKVNALARRGLGMVADGDVALPPTLAERSPLRHDANDLERRSAVFVAVLQLAKVSKTALLDSLDIRSIVDSRDYHGRGDAEALTMALNMSVPSAVEKQLRESISIRDRGTSASREAQPFALVRRWWDITGDYEFDLPRPLRAAAAFASAQLLESTDGVAPILRSHEEVRIDLHGLRDDPVWVAAGNLAKFCAVDRTWTPQRDLQLTAIREMLSKLVAEHADELLECLPWLIRGPEAIYVDLAAELCVHAPSGFDALTQIAEATDESALTLDARGLLSQLRGGTVSNSADLARWASDNANFLVPATLSAPTSIWCDDAPFEELLRSTITAVTEKVDSASLSKEDQVTGGLLTLLADRLGVVRDHAPHRLNPGSLRLLDVTTIGPDEKKNGADLAITVEVTIPGRLLIKKAHLVQAKRAPRKTSATAPEWKIEVDQLEKLIDHDPTATYWLYCEKPGQRILCVPATYLQAIVQARAAKRSRPLKTFKVGYSQDLRSAAIPLGQVLTDLMIGMWIGTTSPRALKIAAGNDSSYEPRAMLKLRIGVSERG